MTKLTPHLVVRNAKEAADWYGDVFGAEIGTKISAPDGRYMQIELRLGDGRVMIADEFPEFGAISPQTLGGTYCALTLKVDDVDSYWARALAAGATEFQPLQDAFWGERHGQIIDPFGHRWGLAQHLEDVSPDEVQRRATALFSGADT
jgi:PhnB protein